MGDGAVEELIRPLSAAVDGLLRAELSRLSTAEMADLVHELEVQRRRLVGVDHQVLAEVDQRGVAAELGRQTTVDFLVHRLRVAPGEAKARVAQARDTQPTQLPSGDTAPPVLGRCAAAASAGEISAAHVTVIGRTIDRIPTDIAHEAAPVAEAMLVEAARHQHPGALSQTAAMLLARLDPDGAEPNEAEQQRRREFHLYRRGTTSRPSGEWTAECTAVWQAILDSLAAPRLSVDGLPDDRSAGQRRHDAMLEAGRRLLRSGTLPSANGVPVTVLLRMTPQDLSAPDGVAQTATGDIWPAARVRRNLGDAALVPIVIDHDGAALMCGRTTRLATRAQRLALAVRDGGCCFPGCDRPAAWCEAHHIIEWIMGGPTDITNLCLLCPWHHREFERRGWAVRTAKDGLPEWLPPPFIDPDQRPLRNSVHHLPEIEFDVGTDVDVGDTG